MKQIPILYSGEMVKAYFDKRKGETRRPIKGEINKHPNDWGYMGKTEEGLYLFENFWNGKNLEIKCPYGQAGDVLVGKETWRPYSEKEVLIQYKADGAIINYPEHRLFTFYGCGDKWRPSIHMYLWASRIHQALLCDPVPQRLWDMTIKDFLTEGFPMKDAYAHTSNDVESWYARLWDSHYGKTYPWSGNFWTWPLKFSRHEG
jgi:hypothetical protein